MPLAPPDFTSPITTLGQIECEQLVLKVAEDPRVKAAFARAQKILEASPLAQSPDGKARLKNAADSWAMSFIFHEAISDPDRPIFAYYFTNTTYNRSGGNAYPTAGSIDNPDNVYRQTPIDGASQYVVRGQLRPLHPNLFSFQMLLHAGIVPSGDDSVSKGVITSEDLNVNADGSFIVTVGPEPANGRPNHLQTESGPLLRLLLRDSLSKWLENPLELGIERVGGPPVKPAPAAEELAGRIAKEMDHWVSGWLGYASKLKGPPPENTFVEPYGRTGAWGYISPMRFNLADDEALVITIDDAGSKYAAIQMTDVWTICIDPQYYLASYTAAQSRINDDGTYTYVLAPKDPRTANWIETDGMHQGWVALRWQGVPRTRTNSDGLIRDFRLIKASELETLLPPEARGVTPAQRERERQERTDEWRLRIAPGK